MFYHEKSKESCENMLFRDDRTIPKTCYFVNKYLKLNSEIWHNLENTTTWLYIVNNDNVLVTCKNTSSVRLNGIQAPLI